MKTTWVKFRTDRFFLTKYFGAHWVILGTLCAWMLKMKPLDFSFTLGLQHLLLLPLCIFPGIMIPVFMHNCTHGNFKGRFVNGFLGELSAFFCLMSLGIVQINHTLHHAFSDTKDDPHPPGDMGFVKFFFVSQFIGANIIEAKFLEYHGATTFHKILFKFNRALHFGSYGLRLLLWALILGPEIFVTFYLPSYLIFSLGFAHVNYITHSHRPTGEVEILNKDDNLYYQFINLIGSGIYYHRNHHKNPRLMDPRELNPEAKTIPADFYAEKEAV